MTNAMKMCGFFLVSAFSGIGLLHFGELMGWVGVLTAGGIK